MELTGKEKNLIINLLVEKRRKHELDLEMYKDPEYNNRWGWCKPMTLEDIKTINDLIDKL